MNVHGLLLDRHVGGDERRHDGRLAVGERNRRWCSDGFEIGCDNGERVHVAGDTRSFARDIGLEPRTTPLESPQSNGMAEAFVRTIKRDYVRVSPRPDAETVMRQLPAWIAHYNEVHPHKALGYRSPREFIAAHATQLYCEIPPMLSLDRRPESIASSISANGFVMPGPNKNSS